MQQNLRGGPLVRATVPTLVLACSALLAAPAAVGAQEPNIDSPFRWIQRGFRVGPVGGWMMADRGTPPLGPGPTPVGGARMRARFSSPLSIELSVLYGPSDRFVIDPRLESGPAPVDTVGATWVLAEAAIQVALTGSRTWNGLQPYVILGGGALFGIEDNTAPVFRADSLARFRFELATVPAVQFGLGTEWLLSDRVGIALEARDHFFRLDTPDGFLDRELLERIEELGLPAPEDEQWTHHIGFTLGGWYYF